MDKNAIKKYAVWARRELISRVSQKALQYGISEKNCGDPDADTVNGHLITATEKKQRQSLIAKIMRDGYHQTMEAAAYTWFNRFSALRFMEVNGYLPSHVRVFTDEQNAFKPQILAEAIHLDIDGLDMEKVYEMKDANKTDELYKYLLITQCNALGAILPGMFERIEDYTELLFPDNLLREGSVIEQMISMIPEDDWKDAVQIIGWLYQYYNTENFNAIYDGNMSKTKVNKDMLPAATQLFTPDWVVRYMVENSLGRLWVEGHPNDELKANWKYYLEEAEQEPEVQAQLAEIHKEYAALKPEEIKVIDPCMGSGHILVYMFDVLVQIYESYGYNAREAAGLILQNNLYGLDIDDRASQLAYFAVMMKARQYDRRIFSRGIQPHVYAIVESNGISSDILTYFENGDDDLKKAMETIVHELHDAKEYGSILNVTRVDFAALYARLDEIKEDISLFATAAQSELRPLIEVAEVLSQRYYVVVTNPPYLGFSRFSSKLSDYINRNYRDEKSDLAVAMLKKMLFGFSHVYGFVSSITTVSWMYLKSYESFRCQLLKNKDFISIIDFGTELFEGKIGHLPIVSWVNRNSSIIPRLLAIDLTEYCYSQRDAKEKNFRNVENYYHVEQSYFEQITGTPIAYSATDKIVAAFSKSVSLEKVANPCQGLISGDVNRFVRKWYECSTLNSNLHGKFSDTERPGKWFPYSNGGPSRKWYGNNEDMVNWESNGFEIQNFTDEKGKQRSRPQNQQYYFREGITWSAIAGGSFALRYFPEGFLFSNAGMAVYSEHNKILLLIGFLNSNVAKKFLGLFNEGLNCNQGDVAKLPIILRDRADIFDVVNQCIELGKTDWDSFETSWDFKRHPLVAVIPEGGSFFKVGNIDLAECYMLWEAKCNERFNKLKANEEELNRIFIDIYGLQDELTPEVDEKDVTVRKADLGRDIRSLISYAVGCMFGRYSLGYDGLAYAGGEWDASKYTLFPADKDNIIPICDDDYFDDDITGRFIKWVETVYGAASLESNLKFISDALGGKGTPREVIRSYFLNDFYADHLKIYQKRPIYWLFDSGKKNGFKALIYMHRYQPDTIARMRTDYVHEQQSRYRTAIADMENRIAGASTSERVKLNKQLQKLQDQATEIHAYEEKIHHLADQMIRIDLDDGVKVNYAKFEDVLAKIK